MILAGRAAKFSFSKITNLYFFQKICKYCTVSWPFTEKNNRPKENSKKKKKNTWPLKFVMWEILRKISHVESISIP